MYLVNIGTSHEVCMNGIILSHIINIIIYLTNKISILTLDKYFS